MLWVFKILTNSFCYAMFSENPKMINLNLKKDSRRRESRKVARASATDADAQVKKIFSNADQRLILMVRN